MNIGTTWQNISAVPAPTLTNDLETEVVIIGGGIAGLTTGYLLAKAGKKVIVLEKGTGQEHSVTAYTTAFLTHALDTDLNDLKLMYGARTTRRILQSHEDAIDLVEKIIQDEHIACDFVRAPHYSLALSRRGMRSIKKQHRSSNHLGFPSTMAQSNAFAFKNYGAMVLPEQAMFHPLKYLFGLRKAFEKYGGQYFEHSKAIAIDGDKKVSVKTAQGTVTADAVVTATYNPFKQPWWFIFKKGMYVSYVYEMTIPAGSIPLGMYEDDENPYHYFRVEKNNTTTDRLIIGGEDHRIEMKLDPERSFNALHEYVEETLGITDYTIVRRWTGPILEQTDGLPLIGRYKKSRPNRYVETAFSGNGMTNGTLAAVIISDMIQGKTNIYQGLYDPYRLIRPSDIIIKGIDYIGEFIHGALRNMFQSKQPFDKKKQ